MQELFYSIARLSAAATLYSMQQVQSSVTEFDTKESLRSLRQVMDGVTNALIAKLDDGKKEVLKSISETGSDVAVAIEHDIKDIRQSADGVFHRTIKAAKEVTHIGTRREKRDDVKPMSSVKKAASSAAKGVARTRAKAAAATA